MRVSSAGTVGAYVARHALLAIAAALEQAYASRAGGWLHEVGGQCAGVHALLAKHYSLLVDTCS